MFVHVVVFLVGFTAGVVGTVWGEGLWAKFKAKIKAE